MENPGIKHPPEHMMHLPVPQKTGDTHAHEIPCASETGPELAVVVLAVGAPPELRMALESLQRQCVPLEIVVVNSGGGDLCSVLPGNDKKMKVVSVPGLLWPGAVRNIGIQATRGPWVEFMASDHIATKNWAADRLRLHRSGHSSVACAVAYSHPRNLYACAYHISILVRRLPGIPQQEAILYGVSYSRSLFEQHGKFREDLRIGEDTDFNSRLPRDDRPIWAPSVQTIHRNPTTFRHMLKSQFARGRRTGLYWPPTTTGSLFFQMRKRFTTIVRLSYLSVHGLDRIFIVSCWPFLLMCTWAYGLGMSAGYRQRAESASTE